MKNFYAVMIDHYEERIKDKSIPILIRGEFKKQLAAYKEKYQLLNAYCNSIKTINFLP